MKKILVLLVAILTVSVASAIDITNVAKVKPTDEMFMDMAVMAAKKSKASTKIPAGAVIILNGAYRSAGTPEGEMTAEEIAISKAHLPKLNHAQIYTINEPTTESINMLNSLGIDAIYFVNPRADVIAAGIYPASAYNDEALDTSVKQAPMYRMPFAEAEKLIKK